MHSPSSSFFLQMAVILLACRIVGWVAKRCGQPQAVGEMIAGIVLGPSLLGQFWPASNSLLFTPETRGVLYVGAQLGIGLYMFMVGLEFNTGHFKSRARSAACVSLAGMIVPFALAAGLAAWLLQVPGVFTAKMNYTTAALFLGAAIAITAFPVMARIIEERKLTHTRLGTLALAAGAIDDAAAWCVLALVLVMFGASHPLQVGAWEIPPQVAAIGGTLIYTAAALTVGRKLLAGLGKRAQETGSVPTAQMGFVLALFCLAAWFTDLIGVHAVFGGFILGIAMPRGAFAADLRRKIEPFTTAFLVPMFFVYSGLNTKLNVLVEPSLLLVGGAILAASIFGKFFACWAAARLTGEDNPTSLAIGSLMNARGMMELILINIGYEKGLIGAGLFAILVVMALVTTLMASPLLNAFYGKREREAA